MAGVTPEQKQFISDLYLKDKKDAGEIITAYEAKYGDTISTRVINKWKYFGEAEDDPTEEDPEEKTTAEGKTGDVEVDSHDSRTQKGDVDISGDEVDDKQFNGLCRTFGVSQSKMFDIIIQAKSKGYNKINPATGEFIK